MPPTQPPALDLVLASAAADGRTHVPVAGRAVRFGSDARRADVVHAGLEPLHAVVAPVKGGGFGLKVAEGAAATLDGTPVRTARLVAGARLELGPLAIDVRAADAPTGDAAATGARRAALPKIPGFTFEKQLGRGAMGRVWLATQNRLDRKVAVKILEDRLSGDAAFVEQFQSEARAAAALHHSNVVTVFDVGEHEGRHYLALEYMDRGSLEDRLVEEGPLPWRAVLGVLRDAASGLEYAESKGIVHRDIKPDNLMQNASGVTKIVDLGLATAATQVEAGGKIFGTAHFIAPEQARGHVVDARADLYSLGVSAWRLLTAATPFNGENSRAIVKAVLTQPAPSLTERVPDLPEAVEDLVLELMAKDPDERPASAREVRQRVEALIQQFSAPGATATAGAGTRGPLPVVLGAVLVLGALGAAIALGLFGGDDGPQQDPTTNGSDGAAQVASGPDAGAQPGNGSVENGAARDGAAANGDTSASDGAETDATTDPDAAAASEDEDAALQRFERRATRALDATDAIAEDAARREALTAVVDDFPGTTAATRADERIAAIDAAAERDRASAADQPLPIEETRARELALRRRAAQGTDGSDLPPQRALSALLDAPVPSRLEGDSAFAEALSTARAELETRIAEEVAARLAAARAQVDAGDFEAARATYDALREWLLERPDPEAVDAGTDPVVAGDGATTAAEPPPLRLVDTIAAVEEERETLTHLEPRFEAAMAARDRAARRDELFEGEGFGDALARFDVAEAVDSLGALAQSARSVAGRAWAEDARAGLEPATGFADLLKDTFAAGTWRRLSVAVPGERLDVREVVAVDADGLVVEADGSRSELPFAAFADSTALLDALVSDRLQRDWSAAEKRAIAAIFVVAATNEALAEADKALVGAALEPHSGERVLAAAERARRWVAAAKDDLSTQRASWLEREVAAIERAGALVDALANHDLGQAAWAADELLERFADTLLASLLSDASERPEPPAWPPSWP